MKTVVKTLNCDLNCTLVYITVDCTATPCDNGGSCIADKCECAAGFNGEFCQTSKYALSKL